MASAPRVHGIANCDTVKRARAWLAEHDVAHEWIDFRKSPPSPQMLAGWADHVGWESLLNRRGTTWRGLDASAREGVHDAASALALMHRHPTLIRRPDRSGGRGFDANGCLAYTRRPQADEVWL